MEFRIISANPVKASTDCLAVGVFSDGTLTAAANAIDEASAGALSQLVHGGDFPTEPGLCHLLPAQPDVRAKRILLVGLGAQEKYAAAIYRRAVVGAAKRVSQSGSSELCLCLDAPAGMPVTLAVRSAVLAAREALYRFEHFKSEPSTASKLKKIHLGVAIGEAKSAEQALREGVAIANGCDLAKDLGNMPANICTPTYLSAQARKLASKGKLGLTILERKQMQALGMNTLLSVAAGSRQPPRLIVLKHMHGDKQSRPIVLVGKGVTFDSGGISLKPGADMDEMKYDMCGAASVLGTMRTVAELGLPINVIGIVPATENMPGGDATRPGDIVTSMSGQTVEILNTDAEGRLILCDALTYAERFNPDCVIDVATLTGACVIALGNVASGLLANDDSLADELLQAGTETGDRAWQLPLWEDYQEQLKSNFADMANIGGRAAGAITAASFLARFTKSFRWAHLDIAGTAWRSGKDKGATGRPIPLLTHFLLTRASVQNTAPVRQRKKRVK